MYTMILPALCDCTQCGAHTFDPHEGYCPSCGYDAVEAMALDHDRNQRIAEQWDDYVPD